MWFTLASRLGMSVDRCQRETSSSKLRKWVQFIREEQERPDWMDYYLAQIAYEVHNLRGLWAKGFKPRKLEDFLVRRPPKKKSGDTDKPMSLEARKAFWSTFFAMSTAAQKMKTKKGKGKRRGLQS